MAETQWTFRGDDFVINPESAEGWTKEEKAAEIELIDSDKTVVQSSGFKSGFLSIEGWILSEAFLNTFKSWLGQEGTLTDDLGNSCTARLMSFVPRRIRNVADWHTYQYRARFLKR